MLIYFAGCLVFLVPTTRWFVGEMCDVGPDETPDSGDVVSSIAMAMCTVWFWPLYLPGYAVYALILRERPAPKKEAPW